MIDPRTARLSQVLVSYSVEVRSGQRIALLLGIYRRINPAHTGTTQGL